MSIYLVAKRTKALRYARERNNADKSQSLIASSIIFITLDTHIYIHVSTVYSKLNRSKLADVIQKRVKLHNYTTCWKLYKRSTPYDGSISTRVGGLNTNIILTIKMNSIDPLEVYRRPTPQIWQDIEYNSITVFKKAYQYSQHAAHILWP